MDTDNPEGPEASIEDRLVAAMEPEAAQEPEAVEQTPEVEDSAEEAEAEVEQPEEADFAEVQDEEGRTHKVPAALKDQFLMRADYTRKTQQTATLADAVQDRMHYVEAREQVNNALLDAKADLRSRQNTLKQLESIDLGPYYQTDPGYAQRIRDQRMDLERSITQLQAMVDKGSAYAENLAAQHREKQWKIAEDGVRQRIGAVTPEHNTAMLRRAIELGFTEKELRGQFADARILELIHDSATLKAIQSSKPKALEAAKKAPPVVKPGASKGPGVAADQKYRQTRESLKKSGSVHDAARLFMLRG